VTAQEIIDRVREVGGNIELLPDRRRFALVHRSRIPDDLAAIAKHHAGDVRALLTEFTVQTATDAVLTAQRLLREARFPPEPAPCAYHCGHPRERCKRCGASFAEHCAS
jgi:hypothetical protein